MYAYKTYLFLLPIWRYTQHTFHKHKLSIKYFTGLMTKIFDKGLINFQTRYFMWKIPSPNQLTQSEGHICPDLGPGLRSPLLPLRRPTGKRLWVGAVVVSGATVWAFAMDSELSVVLPVLVSTVPRIRTSLGNPSDRREASLKIYRARWNNAWIDGSCFVEYSVIWFEE